MQNNQPKGASGDTDGSVNCFKGKKKNLNLNFAIKLFWQMELS